jgi:DNA-binding NarL/FixJ family response regulator
MLQVSAQPIPVSVDTSVPQSLSSPASPHRTIILEPHPISREGLKGVVSQHPGLAVVASVGHPAELGPARENGPFALAVISMVSDREQGLLHIRELRNDFPGIKVVALCHPETANLAERCLLAGATGWVSQSAPVATLHAAIDDTLAGRVPSLYQPSAANERPMGGEGPDRAESALKSPHQEVLSRRERELFMYLGSGRTTREIADLLGLSVKTVATHRINIQAKLGLRNRAALAREAVLWTTALGWQTETSAGAGPQSPRPSTPQD